jgi:cytochrome P450
VRNTTGSLERWKTAIVEMDSWIAAVVGASFAAVLCIWWISASSSKRNRSPAGKRLPPLLPSLPVVGSLPFMTLGANMKRFFAEKSSELGSVFGFYLGSRFAIVLNGRKAIHDALEAKSAVHFAGRPHFLTELNLNPGMKGILRHQYNTAFRRYHQLTISILKQFGFGSSLMETRIGAEVQAFIDETRRQNGRPFDPTDAIYLCISNVIAPVMFGSRSDKSDTAIKRYLSDLQEAYLWYRSELDLFPILRFFPYYRSVQKTNTDIMHSMKRFSIDKLDAVLASMETEGADCDESFVGHFVQQEGPEFDRQQLVMTSFDLLLAGIETTSASLRWALLYVANHQHVQDKLHSQLDGVVPWKTCRRLPGLEDQRNLPYVEATLLELMRIRTVAPLSVFGATLCDTELNGYFIPAETLVITNLYSVHMDADEWKDPEEFRPERFLDDDGNVFGSDRVIPFSVGKRSCIGEPLARQQLFLFFAGLLQQFKVLPPGAKQSHIDFTERSGHSTSPTPFSVRLVPRHADN